VKSHDFVKIINVFKDHLVLEEHELKLIVPVIVLLRTCFFRRFRTIS